MAISIDWATKIITVPQADLTNLGGGRYQFDVNAFRLSLKDLEDDETGMAFPRTHNHNTTVTLSGVQYARTFEVINGYTVEFTPNSSYTVVCINANHNIADVKVVNSVSLEVGNSAGLIIGSGADAVTIAAAVRTELAAELARIDVAISTRESEIAAAARAATSQGEHDATQLDVNNIIAHIWAASK